MTAPKPSDATGVDLLESCPNQYGTILADPPWQFSNRTGKMAPEHRRLNRYGTMTLKQIKELPVAQISSTPAHLYLWVPNALLAEGLEVMKRWGFEYKTNMVWYKVRKDGGPDRRGVGFYFRNVTELVLFGVRGKLRTEAPGRRQPNIMVSRKREHSRKPDEIYDIVESCSRGPYLEMFARSRRDGWDQWGNEVDTYEADAQAKQTKRNGYAPKGRIAVNQVSPTTSMPLFTSEDGTAAKPHQLRLAQAAGEH